MTDSELVLAIAKIIREAPRVKKADQRSAEARDLARYDLIAGLVSRHRPQSSKRIGVTDLRERATGGGGTVPSGRAFPDVLGAGDPPSGARGAGGGSQ